MKTTIFLSFLKLIWGKGISPESLLQKANGVFNQQPVFPMPSVIRPFGLVHGVRYGREEPVVQGIAG